MSRLSFLLVLLAACLFQFSAAFMPGRVALPVTARASLQVRSRSSPAGRRKSVAVMAREYWEVRLTR